MSRSTELDQLVKRYILASIDTESYGIEAYTIKEKIAALKDTFYAECGWRVDQVGEVQALADWYSGLPTICTVAYSNYDIVDLAITWGSLPVQHTEKQADKILENWWNFIANKTAQLFKGYRVPKSLNPLDAYS